MTVLMSIGPVIFEVWPLNYDELDCVTQTEYARKEVIGIRPKREWVGDDDEELYVRGKVFPYRIGGYSALEYLDATRRTGESQLVIRGSGPSNVVGLFNIERLTRGEKFIGAGGVGQVISFECFMVKGNKPDQAGFFAPIFSIGIRAMPLAETDYEIVTIAGDNITADLLVWRRYRRPARGILERMLALNPHLARHHLDSPFLPVGAMVLIPIDQRVLKGVPTDRQNSVRLYGRVDL